jgi:hypothetical protein
VKDKKRTAWIIGTGPSLRNIDVSKLKNEHTITFNRAYIAFEDWGFDPTYYLCIDANDLRSVYKDINNLIENSDIKAFFLPEIKDNLAHPPESFQDGDKVENLFVKHKKVFTMINYPTTEAARDTTNVASMYDKDTRIYPNKREIYTFHDSNGGIMGLKILKALGYDEIAFVGCDARYKDDEESNKHITTMNNEYISNEDYDVNHFRDDYFGKGIRFGKPNEEWIIKLWWWASHQLESASKESDKYPGIRPIKVYSCTKNSNLNQYFPYIPFEDFLKGERQPEVEMKRDEMKIPSLEGHTCALLGSHVESESIIVDTEKVFNRKDKSE